MISASTNSIFVKFWFFGLLGVGGIKEQKIAQNEK